MMSVSQPLLSSPTITGFPAQQQVEGANSPEGDLLGQIVHREGPSVPEHHGLAH